MATAPLFNLLDNSGTTNKLVVTTNMGTVYLTGTVDVNTVDIQININGQGYVSDPSLVGVNLPNFTIPNLNSLPGGLPLNNGSNSISIRAVDISGSVSPPSIAEITVVTATELGVAAGSPNGVLVKRNATDVEISWTDTNLRSVTGFNIYASTGPGGTKSGYLRLNAQMIPADSPLEVKYSESGYTEVTYDFTENDIAEKDLEINVSTFNTSTGSFLETKTSNTYSLLNYPKYRVKYGFAGLDEVRSYKFIHNRDASVQAGTLNNETFGIVDPSLPLYYVVTAVYFDDVVNQMVESRYSLELAGSPLSLDIDFRGIRIRDQSQVAQEYIRTVQQVAPELSLIPGSTVREVHIEPVSNEMQKAYFLMDFVHRSKSFPALLYIDDPNLTGTSIEVANSQYKTNLKTALAAPTDSSVQGLIDNAFDSLALNFNIARRNQVSATIQQTFYVTSRPTRDLYISVNAVVRSSTLPTASRFISKGQSVLPASTADRYYNYEKRRYEIKVEMYAETPGAAGNVPAGALDTVVSGAVGFFTINESAGTGGTDRQSNTSLALEATRALISLDTGTAGGYEKITTASPGVISYLIVRSGDPFMMRDWDPLRKKHIGGKVDIYVKGNIERSISQTYAFRFSVARNVRFDVIDPINLIFRARDSRLSVDNPINEMLFNLGEDQGLYNFSNLPVTAYDLTGVTYLDYRTIKLSTLLAQPSTNLDDFVEGDYRFRSNNNFILGVQPVLSVSSVVGQISGPIDPGVGYNLYKTQDPLIDGESTISKDYVSINQVDNVPSGLPITINNEIHVLIGQIEEPLGNVGINEMTLSVYSSDRSIQYLGPDSVDPDYIVISGTDTSPVKIVRTAKSNIPNGGTVSVDYEHDENFVVTYNVNDVIQRLQTKINDTKHITADVVVKQAIENPIDIITTIQLKQGFTQSTVDDSIRTAYTNLIESRKVGEPIHVSDVVAVFDNNTGVDYVVQPFAKMTLRDGSLRVRDTVSNNYEFLPSLSSGLNAVYILKEPLPFATIDGGGTEYVHHGVYKDNLIMRSAPSMMDISEFPDNSYIIGNQGAIISGYSDDATLTPIFITPEAVAEERLKRTANHILVSLDYGVVPIDVPSMHSFSATYIVSGDTGSKDLMTSNVEYLDTGDLTITFKQA